MATRRTVTVAETIWIGRPPDVVFDYTQNYSHRREWDAGVTSVKVLAEDPRSIRVGIRGIGELTVQYRLDRRPERTSAAFVEVASRWVTGGGGSWEYDPVDGGTRWQQTNTLAVRPGFIGRLIAPFIQRGLQRSMRAAMAEAKRRLESSRAGS